MNKHEQRAESIIKSQGFTFALAVVAGTENDLRKARFALKYAIVEALKEADGNS